MLSVYHNNCVIYLVTNIWSDSSSITGNFEASWLIEFVGMIMHSCIHLLSVTQRVQTVWRSFPCSCCCSVIVVLATNGSCVISWNRHIDFSIDAGMYLMLLVVGRYSPVCRLWWQFGSHMGYFFWNSLGQWVLSGVDNQICSPIISLM